MVAQSGGNTEAGCKQDEHGSCSAPGQPGCEQGGHLLDHARRADLVAATTPSGGSAITGGGSGTSGLPLDLDALHDLRFNNRNIGGPGSQAGYTLESVVTLKNLVLVGITSIAPGLRGEEAPYLVELADRRRLYRNWTPIDAAYNLRRSATHGSISAGRFQVAIHGSPVDEGACGNTIVAEGLIFRQEQLARGHEVFSESAVRMAGPSVTPFGLNC